MISVNLEAIWGMSAKSGPTLKPSRAHGEWGGQVKMAHRVFGPRPAQRKPAPRKTAEHDVSPIAEKLAIDLGQDAETAEKNAQHIAEVLKRALKRRKASNTSRR